MWARQFTGSLLKKLRRGTPFASAPCGAHANGSSGRNVFAYQCNSQNRKWGSENVLPMLLNGQAALLIGGSFSLVFADEVSREVASENDAGGSRNIGLQRVEDGSVISNEHTSKWRIYTDKGGELFSQGKLNEAEKFFSSALEEARKGFGERDPHVASSCNNLAELYRVTKSYDKAEPLYLDAIRILEDAFGSEDVRVGAAFHNLGQFYIVQRKLQEAQSCYERALKTKGRVLGHVHPDYAETMSHLGTVLYLQGNAKDAEVLLKDSIRILEEGGQGDSYSCIRKLRYLAKAKNTRDFRRIAEADTWIYVNSKNLEESENVQRKILQIMELTKGWKSLETVIAAETLTLTLQLKGQLRDAEELLERCLKVRRELLPEDHLQIGGNLLGLANVALLKSENLRNIATPKALAELARAKIRIKDSIRIAEKVLDVTKYKRKIGDYERRSSEKNDHIALIILLQSLKALAHLEKIKHEIIQGTEKDSPVPEAEKALRQCVHAVKEYGSVASTSTPVELKTEYVSCLKNLLNLIAATTNGAEKSCTKEVEELRVEIKHFESEVS